MMEFVALSITYPEATFCDKILAAVKCKYCASCTFIQMMLGKFLVLLSS